MLIDSHCHLDMLDQDNLLSILNNAKLNGIEYMQTICTLLEELPQVIAIAEKYDNVFASCGIHPNEVKQTTTSQTQTIIDYCKHPKIIGIGETGLDYYYQSTDKNLQINSFKEHIEASQSTNLPIIIHTRNAEDDTSDILYHEMKNHPFKAIIHCFTSSQNFAKKMLDLDIYISISGIVTFKNASDLQEIVKYIPLDRLLIETDSPYLAPVPMRGKKNEPAFVKHVAEKIAELKKTSLEEIANITSKNFISLFSKANISI